MSGTHIQIHDDSSKDVSSGRYINTVKRYHKIPITLQQELFEMVFIRGKKIKHAASALRLNYSSAKSLIHYYKKNTRPVPVEVQDIFKQRKRCGFKVIDGGSVQQMEIQIKLENILTFSYNHADLLQSNTQLK